MRKSLQKYVKHENKDEYNLQIVIFENTKEVNESMLINDFSIVFRLHLERPLRIFMHCILRSFEQFIFTF